MEKNDMDQLVGKAFEDLSFEEMAQIQGSGDIQPRTTAVCCSFWVSGVAASILLCNPSKVS